MAEIIIRKSLTKADLAKRKESTGRKVGKPHGSFISDLAELQKSILLCDKCVGRFKNWRWYGYYRQREFPYVTGNCDACKERCNGHFFIHESIVDQCWVRR